ncbi:MAG TPA: TonB family protein [Pyrinomonadaceae bacterium]|nr:TonB family protein [Pyrinomonadaceae bacterium]
MTNFAAALGTVRTGIRSLTQTPSNKSLDANGGSVFRNLIRPAKVDSIRAAASTAPFMRNKIIILTLVLALPAALALLSRPSEAQADDSLKNVIIAPTDWDSLKSITMADDDCGPKIKSAACPNNLPKPKTTNETRRLVDASECYNASNVPKVTTAYKPCYPVIAAAAHASGNVDVLVIVDESGAVTWAHAINGNALLQSAAAHAACKWRFQPAVCAGGKQIVNRIIPFHFDAPK